MTSWNDFALGLLRHRAPAYGILVFGDRVEVAGVPKSTALYALVVAPNFFHTDTVARQASQRVVATIEYMAGFEPATFGL
jgi:hypothetical protein